MAFLDRKNECRCNVFWHEGGAVKARTVIAYRREDNLDGWNDRQNEFIGMCRTAGGGTKPRRESHHCGERRYGLELCQSTVDDGGMRPPGDRSRECDGTALFKNSACEEYAHTPESARDRIPYG